MCARAVGGACLMTYDDLHRLLMALVARLTKAVANEDPEADKLIAAAIKVSREMQLREAMKR